MIWTIIASSIWAVLSYFIGYEFGWQAGVEATLKLYGAMTDEWTPGRELVKLTGLSHVTVYTIAQRLVESGKIERMDSTDEVGPVRSYRLKEGMP